jgi:TolA-binding protein/HEAT repeat protein
MKRITLAMFACGVAAVAQSQTPPAPPAKVVPPAHPAPAPRAVKVLPPTEYFDREDMQRAMEAAREKMQYDFKYDFDRQAMIEKSRENAEEARRMAEEHRLFALDDARHVAEDARMKAQEMMYEQGFYPATPKAAPMPMAKPMIAMPSMAPMPPMAFNYGDAFVTQRPPAPWSQGDPGDSLYRVGYDAHSRGDYRRAAQVFAELAQRYPKSTYTADAMYWEAFDRYRLGSTEELRTAAKVLETLATRAAELPRPRRSGEGDVPALKARIYGELARRGDDDAKNKLQREVQNAGGTLCDREEQAIRIEALSAFAQMDQAASNETFRKVFQRKDECSAELRSRAVMILSRRTDADATNMIIGVAKADPSVEVRSQAIQFLPRLPGDAPIQALDDILKSDTSSRVQRAALRAIQSSENPKIRGGLRGWISRNDVSEELRIQAIQSLNREQTSAEEIAWLRSIYPKTETDRMRATIIDAVARYGGSENEQWVIAIAKNPNESSYARSTAWSRVWRMNLPINDVAKLYDAADTRSTREQIINALAGRKEPEATDKLVEIAKNKTDYNASRSAISALGRRKDDPRALRALADILEKP